MRLVGWLKRTISKALTRARFERDLRDELGEHLRQRAEDLQRRGLSLADARRQARLDFGALERYKEQCREARRFAALRPFLGLSADLKLAGRRLLATPLFLAFAVISLALGVGVTTTVYSVLFELLWKPLGITDPSRVVILAAGGTQQWRSVVSLPDFQDFRERQQSLAHVGAFASVLQTVQLPRGTEFGVFEGVSDEYFRTLGVSPALGRVIGDDDDARRSRVLILSHRAWRLHFNSDQTIIGRAVRIADQPFDVIGVAPSTFTGVRPLGAQAPLGWVPLGTMPILESNAAGAAAPRDRRTLTVVGRLAARSTHQTTAAELSAIGASLDAVYPAHMLRALDGSIAPIKRTWSVRDVTDAARRAPGTRFDLLLLMMTMMVLLVACTNIANLMLSRGALRLHEIAVRRALGAGRWRLIRELVAESAIITMLGAICTYAVTRAFLSLATMDIQLHNVIALAPELNGPAVTFASISLVVSALVFGLEPAWTLTRRPVSAHLASEAGAAPFARRRRQRTLIRWQVAISACFFIITAVLARVVIAEARHDSGIALDRLALTTLHFGTLGWDERRGQRAIDRALEIARAHDDITSASVTTGLPFGLAMTLHGDIGTPDRPVVKRTVDTSTAILAGSPDLLRTLNVPVVRGRTFDDRDDAGSRRVAIVSEFTERKLFGTGSALDHEITLHDRERRTAETFTVVGVAGQTDVDRLMWREGHVVYLPFAQRYRPNVALVAHTKRDPSHAAAILRSAVREADPDAPVGSAGPLSWIVAGPYVFARLGAALAGALGALTLILAAVGLYGVQAQATAHRTREVGVRMALGAAASDIRRMMLRDGFRPVVEGLVIGLVLGTLARAGLRALILAPIDVIDPVAIVTVPIPLGIAALCACGIPAWRAARVDPNVALRHL